MLENILIIANVSIPPEVCIGLGVIIIAIGLWNFRNGKATLKWPTVEGKVTTSYVETKVHRSQGRTHTSKTHFLEYKFEVNGIVHHGSRKRFGLNFLESASTSFQKYHPGREVLVSYSSSKPSLCCLEPGVDWSNYIVMAAGAALLLFGLIIL